MAAPQPTRGMRSFPPLWLFMAIGALVGALAFGAWLALVGFETRRGPLPPAPAGRAAAAASDNSTDSPGPRDRFGFAEAELERYEPRALVQEALENTSLEAIEAAAQSGDPLGRGLLCLVYVFGEGRPAQGGLARRTCEGAAAAGDRRALYQLSLMHRAGAHGLAANVAEADRLLRLAAEREEPAARLDLARADLAGGRADEGVRAITTLAEAGYRLAQFELGRMLEQGQSGAVDLRAALAWYERAAEAGLPDAQLAAGAAYQDGRGAQPNAELARQRLALASAAGLGAASRRLGALYERGLGGAPDIAAARRHYELALRQGESSAQADLDRVGRDN